ncbi:MAG: sodium:proton antiporter [Cyanobacteria bacterium P01_H01_bin.121]
MHESLLLEIETSILALLLVACFAAIALQRFKFPYTVGLVIVGYALGWLADHVAALESLKALELSNEVILFIFVPPLIFESALSLNSRLLLNNIVPILTLAAPGLLISTAIVGFALSWGTPLTLAQALLFGSLISATDPVAVIALFKELGAPKRLNVLVEGESLFNDATAIVTFNIILGVVALGTGFGLPELNQGLLNFFISFGGGIAAGAVIGLIARYPLALTREQPLLLATITSVLAYATFLIGEELLHVSGVIALVTAGIILGWYTSNRLQPEARDFLHEFWEYTAFLANSLIFLLVGLTAHSFQVLSFLGTSQPSLLGSFALTIGAVLIARAVVIFGIIPVLNLLMPDNLIERRYQIVSFWGGLRGAVALALALSLAPTFPNRELIIVLTLGVALFTLLVPGTTISWLMRSLKLDQPPVLMTIQQTMAQLIAKRELLDRVKTVDDLISPEVWQQFAEQQQAQIGATQQTLQQLRDQLERQSERTQTAVWMLAFEIERKFYHGLFDQGFISGAVLSQLNLRVNSLQESVHAEQFPPEPKRMRLPLELRWNRWRINWFGKFAPQSKWVQQWQTQQIIGQYAYSTSAELACRRTPERLTSFLEKSGLDVATLPNVQACLNYYIAEQTRIQAEIDALGQQAGSTTTDFQRQVMDRIASLSTQATLARLSEEGILNPGAIV